MRFFRAASLGSVLLTLGSAAMAAPAALTARSIEVSTFAPPPDKPSGHPEAGIVKAEVLLSRAHMSPGSIDGQPGDNLNGALSSYQKQVGLPVSGTLDQSSWDKLSADKAPVMARYTVTPADAKGPYTQIPAKFERQASLKRLGFRNIREALGERFHMSPALLETLNPGHTFAAGDTVDVVAPDVAPPSAKAASVVVDKDGHRVLAFGPDGALLATYPASIGSDEKPAPTGRFEIRRVAHHPDYTYFPKFHFKGVAAKTPFTIAPGPNNPVGVVWMDLSSEGYGIHGTPEPELVGKTQSHGCIRLTNWDAEALAVLVDQGTPVTFQNGAENPIPPVPPAAAPAPPPVAAVPTLPATPAAAPTP